MTTSLPSHDDEPPAGEESAAPDLPALWIESARSSRSRCRTCRRKIDRGRLRLGILLEGPYGTGYLWHHLTCAAKRHSDEVEEAYRERAHDAELELPPIEELRALKEKAEEARRTRREAPYAERAPSGRSKCKSCGQTIEKDAWRIVTLREVHFGREVRSTPVNVHPGCVAAELRAEDSATEAAGFLDALRANTPELDDAAAAQLAEEIGELEG